MTEGGSWPSFRVSVFDDEWVVGRGAAVAVGGGGWPRADRIASRAARGLRSSSSASMARGVAQVAEAAARVEETLRIGAWRWRAWKVCVRMEGGHTAYRHHRLVITLLISPRIEDCLLRLFVVRSEAARGVGSDRCEGRMVRAEAAPSAAAAGCWRRSWALRG